MQLNHQPQTQLDFRHYIHKHCLDDLIEKNELFCENECCGVNINDEQLKIYIGTEKFDEQNKKRKCPNCNILCEFTEFEVENIDTLLDDNGNYQTITTIQHRQKNRLKCKCNTIFCIKCKIIPYHENKTCEEYIKQIQTKKCKQCDTAITNPGMKANSHPHNNTLVVNNVIQYCCTDPICVDLQNNSCKAINPCGHQCQNQIQSVPDHSKCIECIHTDCVRKREIMKGFRNGDLVDCDSKCGICNQEELKYKPAIKLECNHYVHYDCLLNSIKSGYVLPRIQFSFMNCQCGHPQDYNYLGKNQNHQYFPQRSLIIEIKKWHDLKQIVVKKGVQKLKQEKLHLSAKFKDPSKPWCNNLEAQSLKKLAFYNCFKCKKPYQAGLREHVEHKPEDIVCGGCSVVPGAGVKNCEKHGTADIE